jgi:tripartite-type tricarboxylate transporter receptor subunit TctC
MAEAGVSGYDVTFWQALFAPPGTRAALVARINDEVNRSLRLPEVRDGFAAQGAEVFPGSPARLAALLEHDIALMGRLVRQAKVQPD